MTSVSSAPRWGTIAAISFGTVLTGCLAYAVYFDHRRRTDPDFRRALKRESRRQAKAAKEQADAATTVQRRSIREAVDRVNEEGLPTDPEEVEKFFLEEVAAGETLCQDRMFALAPISHPANLCCSV